jgi:hypothetical protein
MRRMTLALARNVPIRERGDTRAAARSRPPVAGDSAPTRDDWLRTADRSGGVIAAARRSASSGARLEAAPARRFFVLLLVELEEYMRFTVFSFALVAAAGCSNHTRHGIAPDGGGGPGGPCVGLQCQQVQCQAEQSPTTITGTVFAPNGTLPLYNAIVYVPNNPPDVFTPGVTCDRCNGTVSGNPVVITQTGPDGTFALTNVPVGNDIPLVIQIGRWRRQVTIPNVAQCTTTQLPAQLTRFAKNKSEGDIPQMAIATGGADPFECLLLKIGLDAAEFTPSSSNGRVHFYTATDGPGSNLSTPAPSGDQLYTSMNTLLNYDIVILPCEGSAFDKPAGARANLVQYANAGGRLFTTHYSYDWLSYASSPYNAVGSWDLDQAFPDDGLIGTLDTSFPKGMAFAQWLSIVEPGSTMGQLALVQPRHDIDAVNMSYAQRWISSDTSVSSPGSPTGIMHLTFDTPLDAPVDNMGNKQFCGKVVYSDFHVNTDALDPTATAFPSVCAATPMTEQEKALAFMLFDLSSCVQDDSQLPIP